MGITLGKTSFMYLCQLIGICQAEELSSQPFTTVSEIKIQDFKKQFGRVPLADFTKKPEVVVAVAA